ncbi:hypothetical protein Lal_00036887 [Lupinus albus]|nr:hypothetical protein Lal_00036887 [Lupinus albus]
MRELLHLMFFLAVVTALIQSHHCDAASDSWDRNSQIQKNNITHECVGHQCLVLDEDEANMFMDQQGFRRILENTQNYLALNTLNNDVQSTDCSGGGLVASTSCLSSTFRNGRKCDIRNRYCQ